MAVIGVGDIVDALKTTLYAYSGIGTSSALGGRIYHAIAPHNQTLPYLVFHIIDCTEELHFGADVKSHDMLVQFDLWAPNATGADALLDLEKQIYAALQGATLAPAGYDRGVVTFTRRGLISTEDGAVRCMSEARIVGTDF